MRAEMRQLLDAMKMHGVDAQRAFRAAQRIPRYLTDKYTLTDQLRQARSPFAFGADKPCLLDDEDGAGVASGHYFHQDLLVAQRIFRANPTTHVDVGSRIDGFVAHVAAFRPVTVVDIRPVTSRIKNVSFVAHDVMKPLPSDVVSSTDSLSCLHALEHFGLGRYGDPICHDGHILGLKNLAAMLQPSGTLYLSVPIGPLRIEWNAHRVFSIAHMLELLEPTFVVVRFSYVDDDGDLHDDVDVNGVDARTNFGCTYGCGIWELQRRSSP